MSLAPALVLSTVLTDLDSALDKSVSDDEKPQVDEKPDEPDNAKTIRPDAQSPSLRSLRKVTPTDMSPIVEDYSDLAGEDDDDFILQERVAKFKVMHPEALAWVVSVGSDTV